MNRSWWLYVVGLMACTDGGVVLGEQPPDRGAQSDAEVDSAPMDAAPMDAAPFDRPPGPETDGVFGFAHACVTLDVAQPGSRDIRGVQAAGEIFTLIEAANAPARFRMQPIDLGAFLFFDAEQRYLTVADDGTLPRPAALESDISRIEDGYVSPGEWALEVSVSDPTRYQLRSLAFGKWLAVDGLVDDPADAAEVTLYPAEGCAEFPELTVDAAGLPERTTWPDGELFGVVETHGHLLTNFGFGGGGIFHGAPFHRLGVEHALSSCEPFHEADGRRDIVGYALSASGSAGEIVTALISGRAPDFAHDAAGYPQFTDWPNSWGNRMHQSMYYRWLERAWLGGLRLFVQHATGNSVLCELVAGAGWQPIRYSCNDMISVDRQLVEARNMERYIDAQHGGPGKGWFRIVESPAQARAVIAEGKLAVLLGIEISNLFDCFVNPKPGVEPCTPESVTAKLDDYYARGVRAIFPVHKYDNGFSAGDGQRGIIELGNFVNSGHNSNFVDTCPDRPSVFDKGSVQFGGINQPRDVYDAPPPFDFSGFFNNPLATLLPYAGELMGSPLEGDYCQNAGLTPLGEHLIQEMMRRGMIIEVDHLPQRSSERAYALLAENDYPAAATHGNNLGGAVYALGGISNSGLGRCASEDEPDRMVRSLTERVALKVAQGGHPSEGFGFDLNGLASGPRPRFGPDSGCQQPQPNPIDYPFMAFDESVTFTAPQLGERAVDFNTEGMIHIGLLPELIEDARRNGVTDASLEPLFRSAEGYLQMWERAEARAR